MKLLHIVASPRGKESRTLSISQGFLAGVLQKYPDMEVDTLELFNVDLPPVSGDTIDAKYAIMEGGNPNEATQESWARVTELVTHFLSFDVYLVTTPMWNFSIPYRLKHYIDVILQAGYGFRFAENGARGLAKNKKMICITSRGSDYGPASSLHSLDFQEPYLRAIFEVAGFQDITFINAQPLDYTPSVTEAKVREAKEIAEELARDLEIPNGA